MLCDPSVPAPDVLGAYGIQMPCAERRSKVTVDEGLVELFGPKRQGAPIGASTLYEPGLGITGEVYSPRDGSMMGMPSD